MMMVVSLYVSMAAVLPPVGELIFPLQEKHAHASSIVQCPNGDLLACWFRGSGERKANDVRIEGARLKKGTTQWSPPFIMADTPDLPDCNPVLFIDSQQRLWLFWAVVMANQWENSLLKYRRADDFMGDGPPEWSWQDVIILKPGDKFPEKIKAGFKEIGFEQGCWGAYAHPYDELLEQAGKDPLKRQIGWMTRIHPTVLPSGRILLPLYSDGFNFSLVAMSDDNGETWQAASPIIGLGPTQPSIVRKKDGSLVAYLRDEGDAPQRVQISYSQDDGETWTASRDIGIPNPSSSLEVCPLRNGHWLMVCNDTDNSRSRLAVYLSKNEGKYWSRVRYLEDHADGAYCYPSVIQAQDGKIHVTYSYQVKQGESIKHVVFDENWVNEGKRVKVK